MSIKSELTKTASYLRSARKAIIGRGGEISPTAGLKDLPEAIYKIPADASLAFRSDDSVAYRKIVPATAEEYAQIAKIGGMSYKCKYDNTISGLDSYNSISGIQVTVTDGNITIENPSGKTGWLRFYVYEEFPDVFAPSRWFKLLGDSSGVKDATLEMMYFDDELGEDVLENYSVDDLIPSDRAAPPGAALSILVFEGQHAPFTFKPVLTTTEDLFEGLRDTKVTELVSEGANLIPNPIRSSVSNGVTFTVQDDGSIVANGTATGVTTYELVKNGLADGILLSEGETYTLTGCPKGGSDNSYRFTVQHTGYNQNYNDYGDGRTAVARYSEYYAFIRIADGYTANNLVFKPMLNRGSTAAPYKPYRADAVDTFTISAELRAFLEQYGYGRGVEGYPNYIDLERGIFRQDTYRKVFDGTEAFAKVGTAEWTWYLDATAKFYGASSVNILLCNLFNPKYSNTNGSVYLGGSANDKGNRIVFYDDAYSTVEEWKAHLAGLYRGGKPLIVEYALAEPIEVDISAYLKDGITFLKVEGGGPITAVNEREQAVPSSINYIAKVGE